MLGRLSVSEITYCSVYATKLGKQLVTGERRIYHRAAYKCVSGTSNKMHARENIAIRRSRRIFWRMPSFETIQEHMLDPVKLRACVEAVKSGAERDYDKLGQGLMSIAQKMQAAEERKRRGTSRKPRIRVEANISLDQELHELQSRKAVFVGGLPLLHTESIEPSIQQFCDLARGRFERCATLDANATALCSFARPATEAH
jgi:hypothetical protein